jgi:hypothetical protein
MKRDSSIIEVLMDFILNNVFTTSIVLLSKSDIGYFTNYLTKMPSNNYNDYIFVNSDALIMGDNGLTNYSLDNKIVLIIYGNIDMKLYEKKYKGINTICYDKEYLSLMYDSKTISNIISFIDFVKKEEDESKVKVHSNQDIMQKEDKSIENDIPKVITDKVKNLKDRKTERISFDLNENE